MGDATNRATRVLPPRLFIASATETLGTATNLQAELRQLGITSTLWTRGFQLSRTNIENLEFMASEASGAIFLMGKEDVQIVRDKTFSASRDNVLLELGMFIGRLGKSQCVVLKPRLTDFRWPTDLDGVSTIELPPELFQPELETEGGHGRRKPRSVVVRSRKQHREQLRNAAIKLHEHFLGAQRQWWGHRRTEVGYFLRAVRETYVNRLQSLPGRTTPGRNFRLNLMTPAADRALYIACVDYESDFHEDEFRTAWGEDDGKCGYAWKHCVQALYGSDLDIADAAKLPMKQAALPRPAQNRRSVLSTPVFWRDTPVGVLNFDSRHPAKETLVHEDVIRECFVLAAIRIGNLLHGRR